MSRPPARGRKTAAKNTARKRAVKRPTATRQPTRPSARESAGEERERDGPLGWLLPQMTSAYEELKPRDAPARPGAPRIAGSRATGRESAVVAAPEPGVWRDVFLEYKRRKTEAAPRAALREAAPAPFVPGARNWLPLGPTVVLQGQTVGEQPVAGRVAGLAIAPGGSLIYAASANGGVFRSTDAGTSWRSLMDRFDLDPTNFASASLVCGAIALDPADPRRVYVGTGEGDTLQMFRERVLNALPAYRGVGVIRTDDGGENWIDEPSTPDLAGEAFFAMAVDPRDRENVVAATTIGLYRRRPAGGGAFRWERVLPGVQGVARVFSSVVVARQGATTRFFCAEWGQGVMHSDDGGATWRRSGTGFPLSGVGRIALAVQSTNPSLVYAFVADGGGALKGVFRLDGVTKAWKTVSAVPQVLPGGQGSYDLTIAVDPVDANLIYLGGDRMTSPPWGGSIWRCALQASGTSWRVKTAASIGTNAHADVHVVTHTPGNRNELWCGCDGGVFLNRNPRGNGRFASQNNGLACLCSNFIGQHPTDPNILFSGLQDNGTARTGSGPIWTHVTGGDGGYCVVNWNNPDRVLVFANGTVYRSTSGGASHGGWTAVWDFGWASMTQPVVAAPFNPQRPADADIVAVGAGNRVFVSRNFATSWPAGDQMQLPAAAGVVFALAFASPTRLFIGTARGQVFRADRGASIWTLTRLDNAAAGSLGLVGLISDVAVDWADPELSSVYVCFGGMGDSRRVWWFDGVRWVARSGAAGHDLLDVEHNALVVDSATPNNLYVGADIGVWHSADRGLNWAPLQNGLPDAPVFDLQVHPTQRLLRAATHGRGVYEIAL